MILIKEQHKSTMKYRKYTVSYAKLNKVKILKNNPLIGNKLDIE